MTTPAARLKPLSAIVLQLAAGGWVGLRRDQAELLFQDETVRVEYKRFMRNWISMELDYEYHARMLFRAKLR
jgi:hypothetical protein